MREGSASIPVMVVCMYEMLSLGRNIHQKVYSFMTYGPNHWHHGVRYHKLQLQGDTELCYIYIHVIVLLPFLQYGGNMQFQQNNAHPPDASATQFALLDI